MTSPSIPTDIPDVGGETPKPKKAGRNLPAAIASGLALGGLILGTLYTNHLWFVCVVVAAISVGIWEMCRAVSGPGVHVSPVPVILGGAVMLIGAYERGS